MSSSFLRLCTGLELNCFGIVWKTKWIIHQVDCSLVWIFGPIQTESGIAAISHRMYTVEVSFYLCDVNDVSFNPPPVQKVAVTYVCFHFNIQVLYFIKLQDVSRKRQLSLLLNGKHIADGIASFGKKMLLVLRLFVCMKKIIDSNSLPPRTPA